MDDGLSKEVESIENNIGTRVNTDYKNVGYYVAMQRKHRIAVMYKDGFPYNSLSTLKLIGGGQIIGTTLKPEEIPEYKKRDDVMWISEDFVVFPNIRGSGEETFVLTMDQSMIFDTSIE